MTHEVVEWSPARRMQRHRQEQRCAVLGHAGELAESTVLVLDMFDDVESAEQIEYAAAEGQRGYQPQRRRGAARAQLRERGLTDVDELSALERQPRPEAGSDFEASRAARQQGPDERPGIEALRFDETRAGPQRIVIVPIEVEKFRRIAHLRSR
jgi:hypothetical protein